MYIIIVLDALPHIFCRSLPCATTDDAQSIRSWVKTYTTHSNQLIYDSRALVSTFSGESCTFGQSSVAEGWKSQFVQHSDLQGQIFFVPSFFVDPSTFSEYKDVMDGDYNVSYIISCTTYYYLLALL